VPSSSTPGSPGSRPSWSPTGQPKPTFTFPASKQPAQVTLRGVLEAGVEAGCVLLMAEDGKAYLLIGGDRAVIGGGGRLEVVGQVQPDLMTTCQQGEPFQVSQVRRI
jgi:hypothetical protein